MFHRTGENLHYQSLLYIYIYRKECFGSCQAQILHAMCCTGCPNESPGTFIKTCCLKKWSLGACMRFWIFSFGYVLKLTTVPVQPELSASSIPQCHFHVTQIWAGLQPGFPLRPDPQCQHAPGSEIPAPGVPNTCRYSLYKLEVVRILPATAQECAIWGSGTHLKISRR